MKTDREYVLPLLLCGAALTALTLIFPQIGFLEWISMVPLFIGVYRMGTASRIGLWKSYGYGFLTVLCFYVINYHWFLYLYPLDFIDMTPAASIVVVIAGSVGLSLLQAIPGGLIFVLYKLLNKNGVFMRLPLLRPVVFSALWVVFEWSSTLSWVGVPWGRLCLGQSEYLPMLQTASLFGSYFISFLILLVNGLLAYALLFRKYTRRSLVCTAIALSLVVSNLLAGIFLLNDRHEPKDTLAVTAVQGNISSHDKWNLQSYNISRKAYEALTRKAAAEGAELVLWPETAFPYVVNHFGALQSFVTDLAVECQITIIFGTLYEDDAGETYNVLSIVTPDGVLHKDYYAKRHLVPFGEYVPMQKAIETLIPPLAELSALSNDLTPGTDSALLKTEWGMMGGLICFDSIYEALARESVRDGAELLLLSSNDSWFKDSAAIYQHERQAQLRAIEYGRYLVRAGNTGVSSLITDKGERIERIAPMQADYFVAEAELHTYRTLYSIIGNTFVYLCILLPTALFLLPLYWRAKEKKSAKT